MESPQKNEVALYEDGDAKLLGLPTPGAINMLSAFCAQFVNTPLCPPSLSKGNPAANMMAVVLTGREMNLSPMQCLRGMFLGPDGRIGMEGSLMMAVMRNHGISFTWHRMDNEGCKVTAKRKDSEEAMTVEFTVEDAKRAGIYQRDKSQWPKYPKTMCRHRCEGEIFRGLCSDFGGVSIYERTELEDMDFESTAPATDSTPEVQAPTPKEEPARAGRKPKDKPPIDIKAEPSQTSAAEPAKPAAAEAPKPEPVKETPAPADGPEYFVIPGSATVPDLPKVDFTLLQKFGIPTLVTRNAAEAVKASNSLPDSYVITPDNGGGAKILHDTRKKAAAPARQYIVVPGDKLSGTTTADEVRALAVGPPHSDLSTCGLVAQSKANETGIKHFVVFEEGGKFDVAGTAEPPTKQDPAPKPAETAPAATDEQTLRKELNARYKAVSEKVSRATANRYLEAYLAIEDIKEFSKDLDRAKKAIEALEADLKNRPAELESDPKRVAASSRERATAVQESPELAAIRKYCADRGWTGATVDLAHRWRQAAKMPMETFPKAMEFSGLWNVGGNNAADYFQVCLTYDIENTGAEFAKAFPPSDFHAKLVAIRDWFEGAELAAIPKDQFVAVMAKVKAGEEPDLFAGR